MYKTCPKSNLITDNFWLIFVFSISTTTWPWIPCSQNQIIENIPLKKFWLKDSRPHGPLIALRKLILFWRLELSKNSILDVTSRTDTAFNSDHSWISAKLRLRLRAGSIAPRQAAKRYHSPSDSQKENYNDRIRAYFTLENDSLEGLVNVTNFILAMRKAAENTLPQLTQNAKPTLH